MTYRIVTTTFDKIERQARALEELKEGEWTPCFSTMDNEYFTGKLAKLAKLPKARRIVPDDSEAIEIHE